jgi:predicted DNA-binding protein
MLEATEVISFRIKPKYKKLLLRMVKKNTSLTLSEFVIKIIEEYVEKNLEVK